MDDSKNSHGKEPVSKATMQRVDQFFIDLFKRKMKTFNNTDLGSKTTKKGKTYYSINTAAAEGAVSNTSADGSMS